MPTDPHAARQHAAVRPPREKSAGRPEGVRPPFPLEPLGRWRPRPHSPTFLRRQTMPRIFPRTRLALEPLEARATPAGVVDVTFAHGSVTLVGDDASNGIGISPDMGIGPVVIGATDGDTTFRLNGL